MEHQDWIPVILSKSHNRGKKMTNNPKITEEDDYNKEIKISTENCKLIQQARLSKGMKQIDLARAINEKPEIIKSYESGSGSPNFKIMLKIEKVLNIKLNKKKKQ